MANDAIQYLLKQGGLLKPAGEKTTDCTAHSREKPQGLGRQRKGEPKGKPASVPPICYVSMPITEQDVVGIFNQFAALGLFPGLTILATSGHRTYDCYLHVDCKDGIEHLIESRIIQLHSCRERLESQVVGRRERLPHLWPVCHCNLRGSTGTARVTRWGCPRISSRPMIPISQRGG